MSLKGEHDLSTSRVLWRTMAAAIAINDADLVVDMSAVAFIGASTIAVIIQARELLEQESRKLTVRTPSTCARHVLELCDLVGMVED